MKPKYKVIIIGAGLAGLSAAKKLAKENIDFLLLDSDSKVGGRVSTELIDGFTLDKGFQVLLTSYQEAKTQFNYDKLQLGSFMPGALVKNENGFHYVADPLRVPSSILSTLKAPVGNTSDKIKLGLLALRAKSSRFGTDENLKNITALEALKIEGFSDAIINSFFKPFFSGVFLDKDLNVPADFFYYLFKKFGSGLASLPANGMAELAIQLASHLPQEAIKLSTKVKDVEKNKVTLDDGTSIEANSIILAVDRETATLLTKGEKSNSENRQTSCFYFESSGLEWIKNRLIVNASNTGAICNLCIPSIVQPSYAPRGKQLLSVSSLSNFKDKNPEKEIIKELVDWFGETANNFKYLKTYKIENALPKVWGEQIIQDFDSGFIYCGDYTCQPSIQGALQSGKKAAENYLIISN